MSRKVRSRICDFLRLLKKRKPGLVEPGFCDRSATTREVASGGVAAITTGNCVYTGGRLEIRPQDAGSLGKFDQRTSRLLDGHITRNREITCLHRVAIKRAAAGSRPIGQEIVHFGQRGNLALEAKADGQCDR